jgi:hypothetical protein
VWNFIALLAFAVAAPSDVTATKLDGAAATGQLQSWSSDEVVVVTPGGFEKIPTKDLLSLEFSKVATADGGKPLAEFTDGTVLPISAFTVNGSEAIATFPSSAGEEARRLTIPLDKVGAVRLMPLEAEVLPQWDEIRAGETPSDLIVVAKRGGKSLDHLECVIGEVTDSEVACKVDGEEVRVPRSKVAGLIYYRAQDDSQAGAPASVIHGADGLRIHTTEIRWQDQNLAAKTSAGLSIAWPLADVASVDLSAGKVVILSDVKPAAASWEPLVGLPQAASQASQFGRPRFNQAADGGPLTLAYRDADPAVGSPNVKSFAKGVSIRSRGELVYRLPGGYSRFLAEAGIDPAAAASGNVTLAIFGDDRLLIEHPLDGSAAPLPLDLDITGVKRLKIVVDYGENLDTGDWLNLCNARIVK